VVATSTAATDDAIAVACRREGVVCFRGALDDVAGRFLAAARHQGWDLAVRLNGDNIFVDTESLRGMAAIAETGAFDLVTNVPGRYFPRGMSIEVLRTEFFANTIDSINDPGYREHVTLWLYDNPKIGRRYVYPNRLCPEAAGLDLALDTPEDFVRAENILARAGSSPATLGLRDIYALASRNSENSPWRGSAGPLLIAEIGGNHEGNFDVARAMTEAAISSGADCVKFQIYTGDTLVSSVESPDGDLQPSCPNSCV
jgi:spore coat polysaccharide biosynthesis protein SpsF (cytidylyltransferase family)